MCGCFQALPLASKSASEVSGKYRKTERIRSDPYREVCRVREQDGPLALNPLMKRVPAMRQGASAYQPAGPLGLGVHCRHQSLPCLSTAECRFILTFIVALNSVLGHKDKDEGACEDCESVDLAIWGLYSSWRAAA